MDILYCAKANQPHLLPRGTREPWENVKSALRVTSEDQARAKDAVAALWARYKADGHPPAWALVQPGFRQAQRAAEQAANAHNIICKFAARYRGWSQK